MNGQNEPSSSAQLDLAEEIHSLTLHLKEVNSERRRFWLGVVGGLGTVIGATLLAAPILYLLSRFLQPLGVDFPEF